MNRVRGLKAAGLMAVLVCAFGRVAFGDYCSASGGFGEIRGLKRNAGKNFNTQECRENGDGG